MKSVPLRDGSSSQESVSNSRVPLNCESVRMTSSSRSYRHEHVGVVSAEFTVSVWIKKNVLMNVIENENQVLPCPPVFKSWQLSMRSLSV